MNNKLKAVLQNKTVLFLLYSATAIVASMQMILLGKKSFSGEFPSGEYTRYNNYVVFRNSFWHLIHNQDLYALYPSEQWDLYKYSPSFALAMAPFAYMPDWLGLTLWSVLSMVLLFVALVKFPFANQKTSALMLWFVLIEALTCIQNAQSNVLMAALIILAFGAFEKRQVRSASLFIIITFFIKIYGGIALLLFLFYPEKKKFVVWSCLWAAIIALVPLIVISPSQYMLQCSSWLHLLQSDQSASQGISVIGLLHSWFHFEADKFAVTGIGLLVLLLPLIKYKSYKNPIYRILYLANILIWVIIFNHKAESSTFIFAMSGIALWYFMQERNLIYLALAIFAFIFTSLSQTDIFPAFIRHEYLLPYSFKVVPSIVIWVVISCQLFAGNAKLKSNI
jgi:hypothetical protein